MFRHDIKMTSFLFDIINSIITQAVLISGRHSERNESIILGVFGSLFGVVSLVQFFGKIIYDYKREHGGYSDVQDGDKYKIKIMHIVNFVLLIFTWCCFVGDNLNSFVGGENLSRNVRIASIVFLFIGLAGFRLISFFREELEKIIKDEDEQNEVHNEDCLVLLTIAIESLHIITEIDGWYTHSSAFVNLTNELTNDGCPKGDNAALWFIYAFILVIIIPHLIAVVYNGWKKIEEAENKVQSKVYLICLAIGIWFLLAFALIGDNRQPLNCSVACDQPNCSTDDIVRLVFMLISLVVYIGLSGFPICWCIKKGEQILPSS